MRLLLSLIINNIGILDGVDFKEIANAHSKQYYSKFQEASESLNPYWKRYCEINNRLDYLPLGSKEYAETEKECEKAKAEHDTRQIEVKRLYAEYEKNIKFSKIIIGRTIKRQIFHLEVKYLSNLCVVII